MLKPLELPADAPKLAVERAAEYMLGLTDLSILFGVSRPTVHEWATKGRRAAGSDIRQPIAHLRPPTGRAREPIRFRYPDVQAWAEAQSLALHTDALDMVTQRRLGVPVVDREVWVTESEAARQVGVGRSLFRKRRADGRLHPKVIYREVPVTQSVVGGVEYAQSSLDAVIAGDLPLWAEAHLHELPIHRTEAGYPNCATCDGGGCPDCTDPAD